jgi:hypothetical protein
MMTNQSFPSAQPTENSTHEVCEVCEVSLVNQATLLPDFGSSVSSVLDEVHQ